MLTYLLTYSSFFQSAIAALSHLELVCMLCFLHSVHSSFTRSVPQSLVVPLFHQTQTWLQDTGVTGRASNTPTDESNRTYTYLNAMTRIMYSATKFKVNLLSRTEWTSDSIASGPALAASSTADRVLSCTSCLRLPVRISASIPCTWSAISLWYWLSSPTAISIVIYAICSKDKSRHYWRSFIPRCICMLRPMFGTICRLYANNDGRDPSLFEFMRAFNTELLKRSFLLTITI